MRSRAAQAVLAVLAAAPAPSPPAPDWAPTHTECKAVDPLKHCAPRIGEAGVLLEHLRACADIGIVDALQETINGIEVAEPLRRAIWRGFEDHVCIVRNKALVVNGEGVSTRRWIEA